MSGVRGNFGIIEGNHLHCVVVPHGCGGDYGSNGRGLGHMRTSTLDPLTRGRGWAESQQFSFRLWEEANNMKRGNSWAECDFFVNRLGGDDNDTRRGVRIQR